MRLTCEICGKRRLWFRMLRSGGIVKLCGVELQLDRHVVCSPECATVLYLKAKAGVL